METLLKDIRYAMSGRHKEIAIRTALGATRGRIVRQLLTESFMLAIAGATIRLLLGIWGVALMTSYLPEGISRVSEVGIYGVISYSVAQRTREVGIRMALGARTMNVLKLVVQDGLKLALLGVGVGLVGALVLTRLMTTLLFAVTPTDLITYATVALGLIGVAVFACYIPARRATKVDPLVALRYE